MHRAQDSSMSHSAPRRRCSCPYRHPMKTALFLSDTFSIDTDGSLFESWFASAYNVFHVIFQKVISALNLMDNPIAIQWFTANACERMLLCHQRHLNGALTGVQTNCIQLFPFDSFSPLDPPPLNRNRFNIFSEYNREQYGFMLFQRVDSTIMFDFPVLAAMRAVNPMD